MIALANRLFARLAHLKDFAGATIYDNTHLVVATVQSSDNINVSAP
ncbi:hypothetical protein [Brucella intermedia]